MNYFPLRSTPAKLQDLALVKVCSSLWHHVILNDRPWRQNELSIPMPYINPNSVESLSECVPWRKSPPIQFLMRRIKDYMIEKNNLSIISVFNVLIPFKLKMEIRHMAGRMGSMMISWIKHHNSVFVDDATFETIFTDFFDDFVWYNDGIFNLCAEETAKNLVNRDELSDLDKLCLACEYCMEDIIENSYLRIYTYIDSLYQNENPKFLYDMLVRYWMSIMGGMVNCDPIQDHMIMHNRMTLEYFWNILEQPGDEYSEQLPMHLTIDSLNCMNSNTRKFFLSRLNEYQWTFLLQTSAEVLLFQIMYIEPKSDYALQVWRHFKDFISYDQFYQILLNMLEFHAQAPYHRYIESDLHSALAEIWLETPDEWKLQAINDLTYYKFCSHYLNEEWSLRNFPRPMELLILILSEADFEQRKKMWNKNWKNWIGGTNPKCLKHLMNLCLGKNKIAHFKNEEMTKFSNIRKYCVSLMKYGCYNELDVFLNFACSSDKEKIAQIQREISNSWRSYIYESSYANDLDRLD